MKIKLVFLFIMVLFGLNYSFSSPSSLGRDDSDFSEDSDPRSPLSRTFEGMGFGEGDGGLPGKKLSSSKKNSGKRRFFHRPRADSPSPPESGSDGEDEKSSSILKLRRGAQWSIQPLKEDEKEG